MGKTSSFRELRKELEQRPNAGAKSEVAERRLDDEILAHERTLAQIRKARVLTQEQLARSLNVGQPEISRIEHQTDLVVSTLRSYLQAMGGQLMLVARFDDGTSSC